MDYFFCVMGMVLIVEGVPWFIAPDQMKKWLETLMGLSPDMLRRWGLVMITAGVLLLCLGR